MHQILATPLAFPLSSPRQFEVFGRQTFSVYYIKPKTVIHVRLDCKRTKVKYWGNMATIQDSMLGTRPLGPGVDA